MAHSDEGIICPNCGFHATENYCARCGQETHLHNDTFWGLIAHFAGHYFHYDSKFWQTIKALWTSPGKLTIAYWNKQRMRYIPPISLYIFISFVFFFTSSVLPDSGRFMKITGDDKADSVSNAKDKADFPAIASFTFHNGDKGKPDTVGQAKALRMIEDKDKIRQEALHMMPKVFFFLIPLMGFVLLLLFYRRKDLTYVNHIIFAIHYHSFWFSLMWLEMLYQFRAGKFIVMQVAMLISIVYFVAMLKRVYGIDWLKSVKYSFVVAISYFVFFLVAIVVISGIIWSTV